MPKTNGFRPKCIVCKKFVTNSNSTFVEGTLDRKHKEGLSACTPSVVEPDSQVPFGQLADALSKAGLR